MYKGLDTRWEIERMNGRRGRPSLCIFFFFSLFFLLPSGTVSNLNEPRLTSRPVLSGPWIESNGTEGLLNDNGQLVRAGSYFRCNVADIVHRVGVSPPPSNQLTGIDIFNDGKKKRKEKRKKTMTRWLQFLFTRAFFSLSLSLPEKSSPINHFTGDQVTKWILYLKGEGKKNRWYNGKISIEVSVFDSNCSTLDWNCPPGAQSYELSIKIQNKRIIANICDIGCLDVTPGSIRLNREIRYTPDSRAGYNIPWNTAIISLAGRAFLSFLFLRYRCSSSIGSNERGEALIGKRWRRKGRIIRPCESTTIRNSQARADAVGRAENYIRLSRKKHDTRSLHETY